MNSRQNNNEEKREEEKQINPLLVKKMKGEGVVIRNLYYNLHQISRNQRLYYNHRAKNAPILDDTEGLLNLLTCCADASKFQEKLNDVKSNVKGVRLENTLNVQYLRELGKKEKDKQAFTPCSQKEV